MPDQAAGLRDLFARRVPTPLVVAGGDAAKAAVAAHFARRAATDDRSTLLVDATAGELAAACRVHCRYELAQVLSGDRALADVTKALAPNLLLLPAARALARFDALDRDEAARLATVFASGIPRAFADAGAADARVDHVVVNAAEGESTNALDAFGRDARVVVVATDRPRSLRAAYAELRRLVAHGVDTIEVVVPVDGLASAPLVAFANLASTTRRFLGIELVDGGTVAVPPSASRAAITFASTARARAVAPRPSSQRSSREVHHAAVH